MNKQKKLILLLLLLLSAIISVWYFAFKSWDYKIKFSVKVSSNTAYTFIKAHHEWNGKTLGKDAHSYTKQVPWHYLQSNLIVGDTTLRFNWKFHQVNDTLTKISVGVSDLNRTFSNRVTILFANSNFKQSIKKNLRIVRDKINERGKQFKFNYEGVQNLDPIYCIYITTHSLVRGKADEMIRNVVTLNTFVKDHDLGLNGDPMVIVSNWTPASDSIDFDFCFPILHPERMPLNAEIVMKVVSVPQALLASYYGNYAYSDYCWGSLYEKANEAGFGTTGRIIEVFYNDPHAGGNDLNWKAGVYLELGQ